ncbi:MAG: glycosyltransferase family 2 protein [Planctomycetota bacterium]
MHETAKPGMADSIGLSVIAPARDEAGNIDLLVRRVGDACARTGRSFEFLLIDDASVDGTAEAVRAMMPERAWLRTISLPAPDDSPSNGQSAAFAAGIAASRGILVAMLDADLQNDPADLVPLIERIQTTGADLVQGDRSRSRRAGDRRIRRLGSGVGRLARRLILGDRTRDTGCSLRVMRRAVAEALPLHRRGMHRFVPFIARSMGFRVVEMEVSHAVRHAGVTKYGMGIASRAIPGLVDCFAVRRMARRVWAPAAREEKQTDSREDLPIPADARRFEPLPEEALR